VPDVLHHCEFLGEIKCVAHGRSVGENGVWSSDSQATGSISAESAT
jgi:hypothetical protein